MQRWEKGRVMSLQVITSSLNSSGVIVLGIHHNLQYSDRMFEQHYTKYSLFFTSFEQSISNFQSCGRNISMYDCEK